MCRAYCHAATATPCTLAVLCCAVPCRVADAEVFLRLADAVEVEEAEAKAREKEKSSLLRAHSGSVGNLDIASLGRERVLSHNSTAPVVSVPEEKASDSVVVPMSMDASQRHPVARDNSRMSVNSSAVKAVLSSSLATASRASFLEQAKAMFWRRFSQSKRDKRGLFLQCVFPLIFVAVSFFFRGLQNISPYTDLNSMAMTPAQFVDASAAYQYLVPYVVNVSSPWSTYAQDVIAKFPTSAEVAAPTETTAANLEAFVVDVYNSGVAGKPQVAGIVFNPSTLPAANYTLSLLMNTSLTNSLPIVVSLYDSAVLREADGSTTASIQATYVPFKRTGASVPLGHVVCRMGCALDVFLSVGSRSQ